MVAGCDRTGDPLCGGGVSLRGPARLAEWHRQGHDRGAVHRSCFCSRVRTSERTITWRHGRWRTRTPYIPYICNCIYRTQNI
nr:MAG TPA: hypothetical protein [Caudoviricetes sp.]